MSAAPLRCSRFVLVRPLLLLALLLLVVVGAAAQTTLTGQVLDQPTRQPLGGVNIVLKTAGPEAKLVQAGLTDEAGRFELRAVPAGRYQLQVLLLSYAPLLQELLPFGC